MVPYTFIENDRVTALPTEDRDFPMMLGREQGRRPQGPAAPGFEAENVLPDLTKKAVEYIGQRAADAKQGKPFFLYLPLASPHTPIAADQRLAGQERPEPLRRFRHADRRGLGEVLKALDEHGLAREHARHLHQRQRLLAAGEFPGACSRRATIPATSSAATRRTSTRAATASRSSSAGRARSRRARKSDQTICLTDFMATVCRHPRREAARQRRRGQRQLSAGAAWASDSARCAKRWSITRSTARSPSARAIGSWPLPRLRRLERPRPGQRRHEQAAARAALRSRGRSSARSTTCRTQHPEIVARLTKLLEKYVSDGRSTPGVAQAEQRRRGYLESGPRRAPAVDGKEGEEAVNFITCATRGDWPPTAAS